MDQKTHKNIQVPPKARMPQAFVIDWTYASYNSSNVLQLMLQDRAGSGLSGPISNKKLLFGILLVQNINIYTGYLNIFQPTVDTQQKHKTGLHHSPCLFETSRFYVIYG